MNPGLLNFCSSSLPMLAQEMKGGGKGREKKERSLDSPPKFLPSFNAVRNGTGRKGSQGRGVASQPPLDCPFCYRTASAGKKS